MPNRIAGDRMGLIADPVGVELQNSNT